MFLNLTKLNKYQIRKCSCCFFFLRPFIDFTFLLTLYWVLADIDVVRPVKMQSSDTCHRRSLSLREGEQRKETSVIVFYTAAGSFSAPAVQASFPALWLAFCCLSVRLLPPCVCVCVWGSGLFVEAFLGTNNGLTHPSKQTSPERGQLWKKTNKEQKKKSQSNSD